MDYRNILQAMCEKNSYLLEWYLEYSPIHFEATVRYKQDTREYGRNCDNFVSEFGSLTYTNWIVRYTYPSAKKYLYRKVFKCQQNSFNKVKAKEDSCNAKINFVFKEITINPKKNDKLLEQGYNVFVNITFDHSHELNSRIDSNFLNISTRPRDRLVKNVKCPVVLLEEGVIREHFINFNNGQAQAVNESGELTFNNLTSEEIRELIANFDFSDSDVEESYFLQSAPLDEMTKVCRLCLVKLARGSKYFNINAVESFTGFMPYRDQLTTCIPEMALDLIPNPVICNTCRNALKTSYDFKSRCLLIEKKIREYVESQPMEAYDLSEIDTSELPKPIKPQDLESPKESPPKEPKKQTSMLSDLLSVKREIVISNSTELEIVPSSFSRTPVVKEEEAVTQNTGAVFACNHCEQKFPNVPALHHHKTALHDEDYLCNFCNQAFKTLQCLRKHNNICQRSRNPAAHHPVLTKRPHLPTKAKNHLKKWLFRHTDHPYPTDMEKQQLMKETNLSLLQVENWFINARRRILADLTKLKNLRGRQIRRKRNRTQLELADCEDILETEPEKLLDEELEQAPFIASLEEQEPVAEDTEDVKPPHGLRDDPLDDTSNSDVPQLKMEIEVDER
ncbi:uncharacterized protein LOC132706034 isoform X2 [Cylas formicarius]|uniref:uncharacterized protein LOC132706034 isoform X2 n=1 Tax=Cylas formicarius TaxID=197179 RepID=UPI00295840D3|nr:uncharacterized protein LOC132706034 isoform X2 [Cylas formicarius]